MPRLITLYCLPPVCGSNSAQVPKDFFYIIISSINQIFSLCFTTCFPVVVVLLIRPRNQLSQSRCVQSFMLCNIKKYVIQHVFVAISFVCLHRLLNISALLGSNREDKKPSLGWQQAYT